MNLLEKITDTLLSKNWILTLVSFVISVVISIFIPTEFFEMLPFDSKINVIVGFVAIAIVVFLILYMIVRAVNKRLNKVQIEEQYNQQTSEEFEDNVEKWRCFFDKLSDEDYSILMFFIVTENKRPYKEWGRRSYSYGKTSIFDGRIQEEIFYITKSYEESPPHEVFYCNEKKPKIETVKGEATVYTLKDKFYNLLKEIIRLKGSLSHHPRKTYRLPYGNGADLPEFQEKKY